MHYFSGKGCSEFLEIMHYCIGILNMVSEEWYCNLIFVVGRMSECLKEMVTKSIIQLEKRYRLPVAVCLEEEKIYMPNQKDLYGKEKFKRMKREIKGILE